jgi:hypothetical protein
MAATQSSDVVGTIYAKAIQMLVAEYQYDEVTATWAVRYASIEGEKTATAGFPRKVKNAVASVATETTTIGTTAATTTNVDIAVSRVGIAREITNTVREDSTVAQSLSVEGLVGDAARLYGESFDTDVTALFSSVTASVGATTVAVSIANMVALVASQRTNKAKGQQIIHLHDLGMKQLHTAQAAATATPWQTFFTPNADSTQFGGYFMNAPVWSSSKNPTANAAADRVGAIWTIGNGPGSRPEFCAFAFVMKRLPSSLEQSDVLMDANIWASFCRYGAGIVANNFATKYIFANS